MLQKSYATDNIPDYNISHLKYFPTREKSAIHILRRSVGNTFLFPFNTNKVHIQTTQGLGHGP
jgi:hypothetical protein